VGGDSTKSEGGECTNIKVVEWEEFTKRELVD